MIALRNVSKRYGTVDALRGITFEVTKGEIFGYIGPNGAGKTTSLKIVTGLIPNFGGDAEIGGRSLKSNRRGAQELIGYVPQDAGFQDWRRVDHALKTFGELSGVAPEMIDRRMTSVLDRLSIAEHRRRKIVHLSGGTIQKIRIAQALIHDPEVVILDEPLSGLDPSSRVDVKNILRELKDGGKTILLSSHILSDVEDVADRIGILYDGRLKAAGTLREFQKKYQVGNAVKIMTDTSDGAKAALAGIECIREFEAIDGQAAMVHLAANANLDAASREIQTALLAADICIRGFSYAEPNPEEVYLSLTAEDA